MASELSPPLLPESPLLGGRRDCDGGSWDLINITTYLNPNISRSFPIAFPIIALSRALFFGGLLYSTLPSLPTSSHADVFLHEIPAREIDSRLQSVFSQTSSGGHIEPIRETLGRAKGPTKEGPEKSLGDISRFYIQHNPARHYR